MAESGHTDHRAKTILIFNTSTPMRRGDSRQVSGNPPSGDGWTGTDLCRRVHALHEKKISLCMPFEIKIKQYSAQRCASPACVSPNEENESDRR